MNSSYGVCQHHAYICHVSHPSEYVHGWYHRDNSKCSLHTCTCVFSINPLLTLKFLHRDEKVCSKDPPIATVTVWQDLLYLSEKLVKESKRKVSTSVCYVFLTSASFSKGLWHCTMNFLLSSNLQHMELQVLSLRQKSASFYLSHYTLLYHCASGSHSKASWIHVESTSNSSLTTETQIHLWWGRITLSLQ